MKKLSLVFALLVFMTTTLSAQEEQDSISNPKKFINLSVMGMLSTNGELTDKTTNNVSLGIFWNNLYNLHGFSFALFSTIEHESNGLLVGGFNYPKLMNGVQIGLSNGANKAKGVQIGFANGAEELSGVQIGGVNMTKKAHGLQLGMINIREAESKGLQIGLVNSAHSNDFPIGLVNIIKDGTMDVGLTVDELFNTVATFRSGGKYLYGLVGLGYNFDSKNNLSIVQGGLGLHIPLHKRFRVDLELAADLLSRTKIEWKSGNKEDDKDEEDDFDYKQAEHYSIRLMPSFKISNKIGVFGGPSINYLHTNEADNIDLFPSSHIWRKFEPSCFKQIYWGWSFGIQYTI